MSFAIFVINSVKDGGFYGHVLVILLILEKSDRSPILHNAVFNNNQFQTLTVYFFIYFVKRYV